MVLMLVAVLLVCAGAAGTLAHGVAARHQAAAAADLAALAGAARLATAPASACDQAARVARANGGTLVACRAEGVDLAVAVRVDAGGFGRLPGLSDPVRRARAGPGPPAQPRG